MIETRRMMRKNYNYILLDLDGTVIDSGEEIMLSVQYALAHFGHVPRSLVSYLFTRNSIAKNDRVAETQEDFF